jgi:hypothetical protein
MSLMAGFDIILEFSNATVVKLLEANLTIGSGTANPPFDLDLGVAHLIVTDLQIDLLKNDIVRLTVVFNNSAALSPVVIAPLDGSFNLDVHIIKDSNGRPVLNLPGVQASDITLNLSPPSQTLVQNAGLSVAFFESAANYAVQNFISLQPAFGLLPKQIAIVPGVDGTYSASGVRVERVEAHCIPNQDRSKQSLAFFGILLAANDGNGSFTERTGSAITPGDDVCISIAPAAFHSVVVCPALRDALLTGSNKNTSQLPPQCGVSKGLSNSNTFGVTLTSLTEGFGDGHFDLNASGNYSPQAGINATMSVHATITLKASNGEIVATTLIDPPSVSVSLDWWAWFLAAILGPSALAAAGVADAIANNLAENIANGFASAFKNTQASFGIPYIAADQVVITTEGLTVSGKLQSGSIPMPTERVRGIALSGSVVDALMTNVKNGVLHLTSGCPQGDYPYTEQSQQQEANYEVLSSLMGYPMKLEWSIGAGDAVLPLAGLNGNVTVQADSWHPFAPGTTQNVTISYAIDPSPAVSIHLKNLPSDGNYRVWLMVRATDPLNNVAYAGTEIDFEGDHFEVFGSYDADLRKCWERLKQEIQKVTAKPLNLVHYVPVDHPAPDALANLIRAVASIGGPMSADFLSKLRLAHGINFDRAILSVQRTPVAPGFSSVETIKRS